MLFLNFNGVDKRAEKGLAAFGARYGFSLGKGGLDIEVKKSAGAYLSVKRSGRSVILETAKPVHLFRAVGLLL